MCPTAEDRPAPTPPTADSAPSARIIRPTVGRVVWYRPPGHPVDAQPCSAQIAYVHTDQMVNIGWLTPNGESKAATSVYLDQGVRPRPDYVKDSGYCQWMPYQVGQAQRTQELEQRIRAESR